jgi:hypothetical protein
MPKLPRVVAIIAIVAGGIMIPLGVATWFLVQRELADEHIVVSDDAERNAGEDVDGPFTAYSQAMVIKTHALEIGQGQTYAELPQDDPRRETVMDASFLRASLFTSVVAFGIAALVVGLGVLFVLLGVALLGIIGRLDELGPAEATAPAAAAAAA